MIIKNPNGGDVKPCEISLDEENLLDWGYELLFVTETKKYGVLKIYEKTRYSEGYGRGVKSRYYCVVPKEEKYDIVRAVV